MFTRPRSPIGDLLSITTFDGKSLYFHDQAIRARLYGNFGAPPTDFQTRRGYNQDGVTEVNITLEPRTVSLQLWYAPACDRQTYWDNRAALHDFLRPNRNGPMTFTLKERNNSQRSLIVRAHPGLVFPPLSVDDNNWNILEALEFIAFDPLWFDPTQAVSTKVASTGTHLVFPFTITIPKHPVGSDSDIQFGVAGAVSTFIVTYTGTWETYPVITLNGPYSSVNIQNLSTGISFALAVSIAAGEQRIITLTPGMTSIIDALGNNKFSELAPNSDLVDFNIQPDPIVPGGVNTISIQYLGGTPGVSSATLAYYTRYFAI